MRRALKVLAKEWRRRGGPETDDVRLAYYTCNMDDQVYDSCRTERRARLVKYMPPSLLQRQLKKLGACEESIAWAGQFSTARQAWEACEDEFEMLSWLLRFGGVRLREEGYYALRGTCINSPEACAAIRRVVPFERLRGLSHGR
jgi:hypothetical protein